MQNFDIVKAHTIVFESKMIALEKIWLGKKKLRRQNSDRNKLKLEGEMASESHSGFFLTELYSILFLISTSELCTNWKMPNLSKISKK